jgi:crotonobetainyl-CoA:carnitine CoA-transferase CaiB-like acyl-CoA transferase
MNTDATCADGRQVNTGVPPRSGAEFRGVLEWLDALGGSEDFEEFALLELAVERGGVQLHEVFSDAVAREIFGAGRSAVQHIAGRVSAYDFFVGAQTLGLACGVIYAPEEVFDDPHFVENGFPVPVEHDEVGRAVLYPGAPFHMPRSPWRIRGPAPRLAQ